MVVSLVVCAFACLGLVVSVLVKPSVSVKKFTLDIYVLPALAGALFLILSGVLPVREAWEGLTASGDMNPLKILALFLSLTFLSVFLDELGFFRALADWLIGRMKGSQIRLFLFLYALVSVLTVFTSNDVVVLTFTPFICCFCKREKISPVPYLVGEFVAANTWSMALIIGNPTNVYLSSFQGIGFFEYVSVMWLPALLSGSVALGVLFLLFKKRLKAPVSPQREESEIWDKGLLAIGLIHLSLCIVLLAVSAYVDFPMWLVSVGAAGSLVVCSFVYASIRKRVRRSGIVTAASAKRAPWSLVPFVLSMFVIVLALQKYGVTGKIASVLNGRGEVFTYGFASFFASNVVNNIPMSVLFSGVLSEGATLAGVYATIIGSNLGACFTPVGALAGIMWTGLLKRYDVPFGFKKFVLYGLAVSLPSLCAALAGLAVVL